MRISVVRGQTVVKSESPKESELLFQLFGDCNKGPIGKGAAAEAKAKAEKANDMEDCCLTIHMYCQGCDPQIHVQGL